MTRRPPAGYVRIGRLGRSFKLAGGMRLHLDNTGAYDDHQEDLNSNGSQAAEGSVLDSLGRLFVPGLGDTRVRDNEIVSGATVIYLEGVRDRTAARALVNAEVWADVSDAPADVIDNLTSPSDEESLVGVPVSVDGVPIGSVAIAHLGGSNDYVEVDLTAGGTVLLPLTAPYVTVGESSIELRDPPPGLLSD